MKGLAEIKRDNDAIAKRVNAKHRASIQRLKSRIAIRTFLIAEPTERVVRSADVYAAINAWAKGERARGAR